MAWRVAGSLSVYIRQINAVAPRRGRASDGTIGDRAHQGTNSDHNPRRIAGLGSIGVVTAADITHDPNRGCDIGAIGESLRLSRDPRIKYFIFNHRLFSSYRANGIAPWTWRRYSGDNPHVHHGHLSVHSDWRADDTRPWPITPALDGDLLDLATDPHFRALIWRMHGVINMLDQINNSVAPTPEPNLLAQTLRRIAADTAASRTTVEALMSLLSTNGARVDTAKVLARMDELAAADVLRDEEHGRQLAVLHTLIEQRDAKIDELEAALATAQDTHPSGD
jgi:hypothetical protein